MLEGTLRSMGKRLHQITVTQRAIQATATSMKEVGDWLKMLQQEAKDHENGHLLSGTPEREFWDAVNRERA